MTKQQFISEIAKYVKKYAPKYGISVYSPVIAQACLESAYGTSNKAKYYNYFGLKYRQNRVTCANGWFTDGGSEQNADGSYTPLPNGTAWYKFDSLEKGVEGYFQFINISNYSNLKGVTDPRTYLENIKADGYATSLKYVDNVMNVIKTWDLTQYDEKRKYKVAVDAGHGSETAGKRHPDGYREHYSNTYMAFYLTQILEKNNIDIFKVSWDDENAKDDTDVALATRQSQIKAWGADISVSIHANAYGDGKSYNSGQGVETFYSSVATKAGDSKKLATAIQTELIKGTKQTNRGVKTSNLAMCNCTALGTKASVLVETAFMTNKAESDLLKSDDFCRECAREIAQGIFNYLGVSGNVNVSLTPAQKTENKENTTTGTTSKDLSKGEKFKLTNVVFYGSSVAKTGSKKTGTFYVWSNEVVNGRVRMTNAQSRVGVSGMVTGWVAESVLVALKTPVVSKKGIVISGSHYYLNGVDYTRVFNPTWYAANHADVKQALGTTTKALFTHFCNYGMKEGRQGNADFNVNVYKSKYADLRNAFGNDLPAYYKHYVQYGYKENRICK